MTKSYHNGPIPDEERKKTDVVCLILFVIFNLVMLGIAIYSWTKGNFSKLTTPYDPDGKGCGVDYPDYPFIYFASPHSDSLWVTTCVKKCPTQKDTVLDCKLNSVVTSCKSNNNADNTKAVQIYESFGVRNTLCMPASSKIKSQISAAFGAQTFQDKITSLSNSWVIILIAIPLTIILAVIFMLIMRLTAGFFVYILLIASIVSLLGFGIYLLATPADSYIAQSRYLSIIIGVVCIVLGIAIALMFICFRKRIELASSIVKVSTRFVTENCLVMLLQAILFVMMIAFAILWIFQALGYYSLGTPIAPVAGEHRYPFQNFDTTWKIKALGLVHVFYLFWGMVFLVQTGDFIVAGTVTSWYFKRQAPYKESTKRYLSFHIGSVCYGSFLLALIGFIKFVYELLTPQEDNKEGCLGAWKKFCSCCCYVCITWLFDCLNNGAYTFIHLAGESYCTSAFQVIAIKLKDLVISGVVAVLSILFSVLIRVGLTALVCLLAYIIVKNVQPYKTEVVDSTLTMVIVGLIAFTISSFFVSLYANAMDSISMCYLIDKQAGGGQDKCPDELKEFLEQAKREGHNIN